MSRVLATVAFSFALFSVSAPIFDLMDLYPYSQIDRISPIVGAILSFVAVLKDKSDSKLPYIVLAFCLALLTITKTH